MSFLTWEEDTWRIEYFIALSIVYVAPTLYISNQQFYMALYLQFHIIMFCI